MPLIEWPETVSRAGKRLAAVRNPLAASLLIALSVVALFVVLREREDSLAYRVVATTSARAKAEIVGQLAVREMAVRDLAARWQGRPADRVAWSADVDSLLRANLQFRAFEWLEPSLAVRFVTPPGATLAGAVLDTASDADRREELAEILTGAPTVSHSIVIPDAPRQLLVCAPVREGGRLTGTMVGVLRAKDLIEASLGDVLGRGFAIEVLESSDHIYGPVWLESGDVASFGSEAELEFRNVDWRYTVWPSEELMAHMKTKALLLMLGIGLLLALIAGLLVHRLEVLQRAAARVADEAEVGEPRSVERAARSTEAPADGGTTTS